MKNEPIINNQELKNSRMCLCNENFFSFLSVYYFVVHLNIQFFLMNFDFFGEHSSYLVIVFNIILSGGRSENNITSISGAFTIYDQIYLRK